MRIEQKPSYKLFLDMKIGEVFETNGLLLVKIPDQLGYNSIDIRTGILHSCFPGDWFAMSK